MMEHMDELVACAECGCWRPARAPECATCLRWIEDDITAAWQEALTEYGVTAGSTEERELAETIVADPRGVLWRVVDAALVRLTCPECGAALGNGPAGCVPCDTAHGNRWLGAEPDRPGVPRGNEHAIRVASTLPRVPHRFPAHTVRLYAALLPFTIAGDLPTTPQAQSIKSYVDKHGGDVSDLYGVRRISDLDPIIGRT